MTADGQAGQDPSPPTALIVWAHNSNAGEDARDSAVRAAADAEWRRTVVGFAQALRTIGNVAADLDAAHAAEPTDWARWGALQAQTSDFVLAVVSRAWKRRFEGTEDPTRGSGAAAEANVLHGLFQLDRDDFARKVIPVVLPGASEDDLPTGLRANLNWFAVKDLTATGLDGLLRRIHGTPETVLAPLRGSMPPLPPSGRYAPAGADPSGPPGTAVADPVSVAGPLASVPDAELADRLAVVDGGLAAVPQDPPADERWAWTVSGLADEQRDLRAETERRARLRPRHNPAERIAATVPALRSGRTAWVVVAAVPARARDDGRITVDAARRLLNDWAGRAAPAVVMDFTCQAPRRRTGRRHRRARGGGARRRHVGAVANRAGRRRRGRSRVRAA